MACDLGKRDCKEMGEGMLGGKVKGGVQLKKCWTELGLLQAHWAGTQVAISRV